MAKSFYQTVKGLVPASYLDHHESDLYVRDTPLVRALVRQFGLNSSYFTSKVDNQRWIDVPFAYEPYWEKKASSRGGKRSHATMQKHHMYRVDRDQRIPSELRGKTVVYLGDKALPAGGGMMAKVALLRSDGSTGEEYLVREHHLSKF